MNKVNPLINILFKLDIQEFFRIAYNNDPEARLEVSLGLHAFAIRIDQQTWYYNPDNNMIEKKAWSGYFGPLTLETLCARYQIPLMATGELLVALSALGESVAHP